jgi:hypothetical protein
MPVGDVSEEVVVRVVRITGRRGRWGKWRRDYGRETFQGLTQISGRHGGQWCPLAEIAGGAGDQQLDVDRPVAIAKRTF